MQRDSCKNGTWGRELGVLQRRGQLSWHLTEGWGRAVGLARVQVCVGGHGLSRGAGLGKAAAALQVGCGRSCGA